MSRTSMNGKSVVNKQWPHAPEALLRGRLVYVVKFYGDQEVQQAKGTEPIKEAVRKMKFNKQLRKAEGHKVTPKVELCINVDGLSIQDIKTKVQQYKFPLHHISYCADDKTEKKLFTFIAKDGTTGKHLCFVLGSEKNAEEITLTIGQAFDLAYKRFLDKKENQMDKEKQFMLLQQQVQRLQEENKALKKRVAELEGQNNYSSALSKTLSSDSANATTTQTNNKGAVYPEIGTKLEGLLFTDDFNPTPPQTTNGNVGAAPSVTTTTDNLIKLAPPPTSKSSPRTHHQQQPQVNNAPDVSAFSSNPLIGGPPSASNDSTDAFGMPTFNPRELADMEHGFKGGMLAIGIEDFDINSLDPLSHHQ